MAQRPASRGRLDARPPSSQGGIMRPASPRIQLQPLQNPAGKHILGGGGISGSDSDKEQILTLKKDVRRMASKLADYANAIETDKRMLDASSLLRRPLTSGGSFGRPPSPGGSLIASSGPLALSSNIETLIDQACSSGGGESARAGLLELLFTVMEEAQRCTITLTEKRAPSKVHVPPPGRGIGRTDTRREVVEALMERALSLHAAIDAARNSAEGGGGQRGRGMAGALDLGPGLVAVVDAVLEVLRVYGRAAADVEGMLRGVVGVGGDGKGDGGELESEVGALASSIEQAGRMFGDGGGVAVPLKAAAGALRGEVGDSLRSLAAARRLAGRMVAGEGKGGGGEGGGGEGGEEGREEELQRELDEAKAELARAKSAGGDDEMGIVQDVMNAAKIQALTEDNRQLKAENDRLKAGALRLNLAGAVSRPQTAQAGAFRDEIAELRGELVMTKAQVEKERGDVLELESRLRGERDRCEDVQRLVEARDEMVAHLRSQLESQERISAAEARGGDTFEEVLAEEMVAMRQAYEQRLTTLKQQLDAEQLGFAKERREGREAYDKELRALRRRVDILASKAGHLVDPKDLMTPAGTPRA